MDTLNTPTIRKKLRKLSAQDPAESRKRWQHVTTALTSKDVDAATDAKHAVSQSESNACHLCGLLCMKCYQCFFFVLLKSVHGFQV